MIDIDEYGFPVSTGFTTSASESEMFEEVSKFATMDEGRTLSALKSFAVEEHTVNDPSRKPMDNPSSYANSCSTIPEPMQMHSLNVSNCNDQNISEADGVNNVRAGKLGSAHPCYSQHTSDEYFFPENDFIEEEPSTNLLFSSEETTENDDDTRKGEDVSHIMLVNEMLQKGLFLEAESTSATRRLEQLFDSFMIDSLVETAGCNNMENDHNNAVTVCNGNDDEGAAATFSLENENPCASRNLNVVESDDATNTCNVETRSPLTEASTGPHSRQNTALSVHDKWEDLTEAWQQLSPT
jgi:hypothetical protein